MDKIDKMDDGCCKMKTKKEKILSVVSMALFSFALAITIALILVAVGSNKNNICESKVCLEAATKIVRNMDATVDPCNNFYDYACGNYKKTIISAEYQPQNAVDEMQMGTNAKLTELLEEPSEYNEPKIFTSVKDFFASCINTTQINELGLQPLKTFIHKLGEYPIVEGKSWNVDKFSWTETLSKFRYSGLRRYGIFAINVKHDPEKSAKRIIHIEIIPTTSPSDSDSDSIFDDPNLLHFYNSGVNISVMLGATRSSAENEFREVTELVTKIAMTSNFEDPEEKKMTVNDLQNKFPHVTWVDFLNNLDFPKTITENDEVLVADPNHFSKVSYIISNTDTRVVANTLIADAITQVTNLLDEKVQEFLKKIGEEFGMPFLSPSFDKRRVFCLHMTDGFFSIALGALYIRSDEFNPDSKQMVEDIYENIKKELSDGITNIEWFKSKSTETAQNKIELLRHKIGYPESLLHDSAISDYYTNVVIAKEQFFYNMLNLTKNLVDQSYNLLTKSTDEEELFKLFLIPSNSPDYIHDTNTIDIFATYLRRPQFHPDWPNYLNYGAIGTRIGRNLMYVIDRPGRYFDANGQRKDWWHQSTVDKYEEVQNCINEQYESFLIRLRTEKIFDVESEKQITGEPCEVLGVSYAYKAYLKWEKSNKPETLLPGLKLTNRQLFWMSLANTRCEGFDDIVPADYSTLSVALLNSPEFANDFNCPVGSSMNPRKC